MGDVEGSCDGIGVGTNVGMRVGTAVGTLVGSGDVVGRGVIVGFGDGNALIEGSGVGAEEGCTYIATSSIAIILCQVGPEIPTKRIWVTLVEKSEILSTQAVP